MKKEKKESGCGCGLIAILLVICLFVFFMFDDEEEKSVENFSDKTYTLMVYMCGSDLESEDGAATSDLKIKEKNDKYYIHLSDEKWDNVADLGLSL